MIFGVGNVEAVVRSIGDAFWTIPFGGTRRAPVAAIAFLAGARDMAQHLGSGIDAEDFIALAQDQIHRPVRPDINGAWPVQG